MNNIKEPVFEINKSKVLEKYENLHKKGLIVSYSVKTNPLIASILEENTDSLFSVHFENELEFIKDKRKVIFLLQGTDEKFLKKLVDLGITNFVVDNKEDLDVIEDFPEKNKLTIALRMKLKENSIFTEKYFVFGMNVDFVCKKVLELKGKVKSIGIHFHRKTQNISEWSLKEELEDSLSLEVLKAIDFINIGGGLPADYKNSSAKYIDSVFLKINELRKWLDSFNIKTIIEPGRYIASNGILRTYVKAILNNNEIVVNASVYNTFPDTLVDNVKLLVANEGKGKEYVIKGCTPCSLDMFRYSVKLENVKIGDEIVFLNATAYNYYTDFCNLEKVKSEIVE